MKKRYGSTSTTTHRSGGGDDDDDGSVEDKEVAYCDHYPHEEDEEMPLTSGHRKNKYGRRSSSGSGGYGGGYGDSYGNNRNNGGDGQSCWTKFTRCVNLLLLPSFLLLATVTALSILSTYRLQKTVSSLTTRLNSLSRTVDSLDENVTDPEDGIIHNLLLLNDTVAEHSVVISRFNNSVSNADVLKKLKILEAEWKAGEELVQQEMEDTKVEIAGVLESTKKSIDETVSQAQNQIQDQVRDVQVSLSSYIRTTQDQFSTENSFMVYQLAGTFTLLMCLISMWHMTSHLRHFHQPIVQRKILAILWMCPIYGVTSWLSLVLPGMEGYLAIFKDLYEAYVIYQFLSFLIAVLGKGDRESVVDLLAEHAGHLSPPVRCFGCCRKHSYGDFEDVTNVEGRRQLADDVLLQCQVFAMQFVFLRPLLTAILFALKKIDYHGPMFGGGVGSGGGDDVDDDLMGEEGGGTMDYRSPQFYLVILENVSVFIAFSGLLKFYHAVQEDLSWCRPFPKFLCIKGVVFMTFWQGVVIALLADTTDFISGGSQVVGNEDEEKWAKQAQNFLICLEMLGFSIAHFYCFPVEEWEEGYRPKEKKSKFGDNLALGDFLHDLKLILRHNEMKRKVANQKLGAKKLKSDDSITTLLEEDEDLGHSSISSDEGLQTLLDDVGSLLESQVAGDGGTRGSKRRPTSSTSNSPNSRRKTSPLKARQQHPKDTQEYLKSRNAPWELRQATALLLQSALLDGPTARLLAGDILDQSMEEGEEDDADEENVVGDSASGDGDANGVRPDEGREDREKGLVEACTSANKAGKGDKSDNSDKDKDLKGKMEGELSEEKGDSSKDDNNDKKVDQKQQSKEDEAPATESSSLLSDSSRKDDMLRPSIFTYVHQTSQDEEP